jgi:hypothetical protein
LLAFAASRASRSAQANLSLDFRQPPGHANLLQQLQKDTEF